METKDLIIHKMRRLKDINKAPLYLIYVDKEICHIDKPKAYKSEKEAIKDINKYFNSLPSTYVADVEKLIKEGTIEIKKVINEYESL